MSLKYLEKLRWGSMPEMNIDRMACTRRHGSIDARMQRRTPRCPYIELHCSRPCYDRQETGKQPVQRRRRRLSSKSGIRMSHTARAFGIMRDENNAAGSTGTSNGIVCDLKPWSCNVTIDQSELQSFGSTLIALHWGLAPDALLIPVEWNTL